MAGLQPDLVSDVGWWETPLWQYAVYAVVNYSRAAAERTAVPVAQIARRSPPGTASSSSGDQSWSRRGAHEGRYLAVSRRAA
ncbi:hypothetical protein [Geodermatophilus sp. DSM 45219]|uniref:hypothetical protein n=1 Tax=Geodermatophilus sp. DSM 45219 TaxID=1881103 RepID=UPI001C40B386|nr:hypothetical protein [Geodermatophilus sp. DSM 45219]